MSALYTVEVDERRFSDADEADQIARRMEIIEDTLARVPPTERALVVLSASFFRVTAPLMGQIALRECVERTRGHAAMLILGVETIEGLAWAPLEHEPRRTVHAVGHAIETITPGESVDTGLGVCGVVAGKSAFDPALCSTLAIARPKLIVALSAGAIGPRWVRAITRLEQIAPTFPVGAMHRSRDEFARPRSEQWIFSASWLTPWGRVRQYRPALRAEDSTILPNEAMMSAL